MANQSLNQDQDREASIMKAIGEEFTMGGKKYKMLGVEPNGKVKLQCLYCGGKIVYKDASQIPN